MKLGDLRAAERIHARFSEWNLKPDAATLKYLVQLMCQGLKLGAARTLLQEVRAQTDGAEVLGGLDNDVFLNVSVARIACLLGQRKLAERALSRAEQALQQNKKRGSADLDQAGMFAELRWQELQKESKELRSMLKGEEETYDIEDALRR